MSKKDSGGQGARGLIRSAFAQAKRMMEMNRGNAAKDGYTLDPLDVMQRVTDLHNLGGAVATIIPHGMAINILEPVFTALLGSVAVALAKLRAMVLLEKYSEAGASIPATPYAMLTDIMELVPAHEGEDEGYCCTLDYVQLLTSRHAEHPSVVALVKQGRTAAASRRARILDAAAVVYAFSLGALPLADEDAREYADEFLAIVASDAAEAAAEDNGSGITRIVADNEADAIRRLIGEGGPDQLPPSVS